MLYSFHCMLIHMFISFAFCSRLDKIVIQIFWHENEFEKYSTTCEIYFFFIFLSVFH